MKTFLAVAGVAFGVAALGACAGADSTSEHEGQSDARLVGAPTPPVTAPATTAPATTGAPNVPAYPPPNATDCPTVETACTLVPQDDPVRNPPLAALGCSSIMTWKTNAPSSANDLVPIQAGVALCFDTPSARTAHPIFAAQCAACMPQAPAGQIYVEAEGPPPPNCPDGCKHTTGK